MTEPTKQLTLYELADAMARLEILLDEDDGLTEYLDGVQLQLNDKVDNIVRFSKNLELTTQAIDTELARLTELKRSFQTKRQRLLDYVKYVMEKFGFERIDTGIARLSFRNTKAVVIDDETKVPRTFVVTKTTESIDKLAIKQAITSGAVVPGAHLQENHNLQLK